MPRERAAGLSAKEIGRDGRGFGRGLKRKQGAGIRTACEHTCRAGIALCPNWQKVGRRLQNLP
jgi:hypothetical protein